MKQLVSPFLALLLCAMALAANSETDQALEKRYEQLLKNRPEIKRKVESGNATKAQVLQWLRNGGDKGAGKKSADKQYYDGKRLEVKDPTEFKKTQQQLLFSGPQPGEMLPAFKVTGIRGDSKGKEYDPVAQAQGKPQVLIFQDQSGVGIKGLYLFGSALTRIAEKAELHVSTTFLGDDPNELYEYGEQFVQGVPDAIQLGRPAEGRDGPGIYGLNRNVAMTILIAKDGKVVHNFAFAQPMLYADPYVLGAVAEVVGEDRRTVANWLAKKGD